MGNKRNIKGMIGWLCVSLLIGIIALPAMVLREIYQWAEYDIVFEWDDIVRYSVVIAIGSVPHYLILWLLWIG